ncbi:hypothetical protein [Paenibacillus campi]|uniref:hypothetical protein n=1 Tax=Paenibacillus campi TaxID=3106031 RepID=UPI002AFFEAFA|nr:hypothetical protein [Paenibacillus sp. SGZ-1009]
MSLMKKIAAVSIVTSLGLASLGVSPTLPSSYAASLNAAPSQQQSNLHKDDMVVTYKANEITDVKELAKRAKAGVSDLSQAETNQLPSLQIKDTNAVNHKAPVFKTAQLLQTSQSKDGTKVERLAVTAVAPDIEKTQKQVDKTLGNVVYSTIYVDKSYDSRGAEYLRLVRVKGHWDLENNVTISGKITAGQAGPTFGGIGYSKNQTWDITATSFDYTLPSDWKPVANTGAGGAMSTALGVTITTTYKRGNAVWTEAPFSNNI